MKTLRRKSVQFIVTATNWGQDYDRITLSLDLAVKLPRRIQIPMPGEKLKILLPTLRKS